MWGRDSFPNAVRGATQAGVPCVRPFTDIQLLQFIEHGHVDWYGFYHQTHVLNNPGNRNDTLITYVDGDDQKEELQELVSDAGVHILQALNVTQAAASKAGLYASSPLEATTLSSIGLKVTSDVSWSLTFGNGRIQKKSVSIMGLSKFLNKYGITWCPDTINFKAMVTAIYSVTGGLTYTGDAKLVTSGGGQLRPTPTGPVNVNAGWEYTLTNSGKVVLSEINPHEWIIAIEYRKLEQGRRTGGTGNKIRIVRT
ncbi:hypothetical protein MHU86_14937 [Fragilaria crotonensis]|nr:hypothetical protein MHU86_14937 [Fragilaria crotonensis]